eukprot:TRINITY_DN6983_c0_g1_i5.p1 TRINITY_DN6983_c0_g1~~TRINITY_DN6983_c0_g1_i5.p1  ORF type:complete len:1258 (-),score=369.34 TRINITY_DN6983_c0_g1_i5:329-4102(-)
MRDRHEAEGFDYTRKGPYNSTAFEDWVDKSTAEKAGSFTTEAEPRSLEIYYFNPEDVENADREQQTEIVFEDPNEGDKRPRLLVSLQSVMGLKSLCEREFSRVETLQSTLALCRTAYFKELLWLREQLIIATRPEAQVVWDYVMSFEVYWYDPPSYVDPALKEFMLDCNRITNKRLIEELYELRMRISGKDDAIVDDDKDLKRILKKFGSSKLLKRLWSMVSSRELGSPEQQDDFKATCKELFPESSGREKKEQVAIVQKGDSSDLLKKEIQELQEKLKAMEELRKSLKQAMKELDEAQRLAAAEKARADAEKQRADAEKARADQAMRDLQKMQEELKKKQPDKAGVGKAEADMIAGKILNATVEIAKKINVAPNLIQPTGKGEKLAQAVQSLEALARQNPKLEGKTVEVVKEKIVTQGDNAALHARIKELEEQLRKVMEEMASVQEELQKRVEELEAREKELLEQAEKLKAQIRKLKDQAPVEHDDSELRKRIAKMEEDMETLAMKLTRAQDKIQFLKEELKKYKRMAGVAVDSDDDDDDSDYDGDIPKFLISYFRRIKNSQKPRWQLLSEDAPLARKKREWLFTQKVRLVEPTVQHSLLSSEATAAFNFLRYKESHSGAHKIPKASRRQHQVQNPPSMTAAGMPPGLPPNIWEILESHASGNAPPGSAAGAALAAVQAHVIEEAMAARKAAEEAEKNKPKSPKTEKIFAVAPGYTVSPYILVGTRETDDEECPTNAAPSRRASLSPNQAAIASAAAAAASAAAHAKSQRHQEGSLGSLRTRSSSPDSPKGSFPNSPSGALGPGGLAPVERGTGGSPAIVSVLVPPKSPMGGGSRSTSPKQQGGGQAVPEGARAATPKQKQQQAGRSISPTAAMAAHVAALQQWNQRGGPVHTPPVASPFAQPPVAAPLTISSGGKPSRALITTPLQQRQPPPGWAARDAVAAVSAAMADIAAGAPAGGRARSPPRDDSPPRTNAAARSPPAPLRSPASSPGPTGPQLSPTTLAAVPTPAAGADQRMAKTLQEMRSRQGQSPPRGALAPAAASPTAPRNREEEGFFSGNAAISPAAASQRVKASASATPPSKMKPSKSLPSSAPASAGLPQTRSPPLKASAFVNQYDMRSTLGWSRKDPAPSPYARQDPAIQAPLPSPAMKSGGAAPPPPESALGSSPGSTMRRNMMPAARSDVMGMGRSRSELALPITNAGKAVASSPAKPRRPSHTGHAGEAAAPEAYFPDPLPPLPKGRVLKQQQPPSWLTPP